MATRRGGWVPVPRGKAIALLDPIHIKRWGYEVDRETVLAKMVEETKEFLPDKIFVPDRVNPHLLIAEYHPKFKTYWEKMAPSVRDAISSLHELKKGDGWLDFEAEEKLIHDVHFKVVERYVRQIVKERMWKQQERKLWTGGFNDSVLASGAWRGPWVALYKRVVKTGMYHPATGGSEDCDPASLGNEKTHVLLWIEREAPPWPTTRKGDEELTGQFIVERTNTTDWAHQRVSDILMEAK